MATEPKEFSDLNLKDELKNALLAINITKMTEVQRTVIPELLKRRDVIVQSQTGSGKTLGFMVPIINLISNQNRIEVLVVAPTRELCMQIKQVADQLVESACECFIGGQDIENDKTRLNCQIAVATPGRILELLKQESKAFKSIRYLILDEADKLLGAGFESKLVEIIKMLPKERVTGLFSATTDDSVLRLARNSLHNPSTISVQVDAPSGLSMSYVLLDPSSKLSHLFTILSQNDKTIVFFATCAQVELFYHILLKLFNKSDIPRIFKIHGRMEQSERLEVYGNFERNGHVLLCTDVAARGIDFKFVKFVIHFDIPKDYSNVVHRSGRTARIGASGKSILYVMPSEQSYIKFLALKGIVVEEDKSAATNSFVSLFKDAVNEEILNLAVLAFVSYIRSYKEHILNYVLDYRELDYDGLAELFFLERIPTMKELRNVKFKNFDRPAQTKENKRTRNTRKKLKLNAKPKNIKH